MTSSYRSLAPLAAAVLAGAGLTIPLVTPDQTGGDRRPGHPDGGRILTAQTTTPAILDPDGPDATVLQVDQLGDLVVMSCHSYPTDDGVGSAISSLVGWRNTTSGYEENFSVSTDQPSPMPRAVPPGAVVPRGGTFVDNTQHRDVRRGVGVSFQVRRPGRLATVTFSTIVDLERRECATAVQVVTQ